ncbi:MAG: hypothetical protein KF863_11190 [Rubrivivax sp.]|nr:hypothetical protein [Rubrivivax sp.]
MPTAPDPRPAQAERAADYMERHPGGVTVPELEAACDLGSATKVLSDMPGMGYVIGRRWRLVPCLFGSEQRRRRVYVLLSRPAPAAQLTLPLGD